MFHRFFQSCSEQFPVVLYVLGNHEHYHGDFAKTHSEMRKKLAYLENVHILDKEAFDVGDVRFIGGTLWTDMNKEDPLTMYGIRKVMNDFRSVKNSSNVVHFKHFDENGAAKFSEREAYFCAEDAVEDHKKYLKMIDETCSVSGESKVVVISHHTPTFQCCAPEYSGDTIMNGGFHSELSEFILDHEPIRYWICGHTHDVYDIEIGWARVLCNPRGYHKYEQRAANFELKYFEV